MVAISVGAAFVALAFIALGVWKVGCWKRKVKDVTDVKDIARPESLDTGKSLASEFRALCTKADLQPRSSEV
jgi:hypothetical protein